VYDLQHLELTELRKIVTAYVREYVEKEKIYLSETDQCRLMLEILTAMQR
jgi:pilus assembly protein CpaF